MVVENGAMDLGKTLVRDGEDPVQVIGIESFHRIPLGIGQLIATQQDHGPLPGSHQPEGDTGQSSVQGTEAGGHDVLLCFGKEQRKGDFHRWTGTPGSWRSSTLIRQLKRLKSNLYTRTGPARGRTPGYPVRSASARSDLRSCRRCGGFRFGLREVILDYGVDQVSAEAEEPDINHTRKVLQV